MAARVFLGWDRPFAERAAEWLLARREALPGMCVVVPTAGSARRLREALVEAAGGVLGPRVTTPGALLQAMEESAAPAWVERTAWVEVLEATTDWHPYTAVFPEPPGSGTGWAWDLAGEMLALRHALQDAGLMLETAARRLGQGPEADRWMALAALEQRVEETIRLWGMISRSRRLASGLPLRNFPEVVVLAGVTDLSPLLAAPLLEHGATTVLIAAPEAEAAEFDALGIPLEAWLQRPLPWPSGTWGAVTVAANPRQQADETVRCLAASGTPSDQAVVGCADEEVSGELVRVLGDAGWAAFDPAAKPPTAGLPVWLGVWRRWLEDTSLAVMADLLALPESAALTAGAGLSRAGLALRLAELRGTWMVQQVDDLSRRMRGARFRNESAAASAAAVMSAAESLDQWRGRFAREPFATAAGALLDRLAAADDEPVRAWLAAAAPFTGRVRRPAGYWLDLLLEYLPQPQAQPPENRALDVLGWLELLYESAPHLVVCGMNEGHVPARGGGDPWLGESARKALGLADERLRAARDGFLYQALLEARRDHGRVDLICGKAGASGDPLLPSRFLLAAERNELPARVAGLFREVEPPDAGLRRQLDWQWQPRLLPPPTNISVTSLSAYLACPFRFYLTQIAGMRDPETARAEWNQRDFGNIAHAVLEKWGGDQEAREFSKTEAIADWLSAELDRVVGEWFGKRVPLAVRIQTEALRQRLGWFARVQAVSRAEGWQIVDVERRVEIPVGDALLIARIDRIDRHEGTGEYRVLDYKTGRIDHGVAGAHRTKITNATRLPAHLGEDGPAVFQTMIDQKPATCRWINLQLPLYAVGLTRKDLPLPVPCYCTLGATENHVVLEEWTGFSQADADAALGCAEWVAGMIRRGVFWPPAERVTYDDFEVLAAGGPLVDAFANPWAGGEST